MKLAGQVQTNRLQTSNAIKIIMGSAFFWAWMDAIFMSVFFLQSNSKGFMSELAFLLVFLFAIPVLLLAFFRRRWLYAAITNSKLLLVFAGFGSLGSTIFVLAGEHQLVWALLLGGAFAGFSMAIMQMAWGGIYSSQGAKTAAPYVAGGFACAIIIDIPLLLMIPEASAIFFASLPVISGVFLATCGNNTSPQWGSTQCQVAQNSAHGSKKKGSFPSRIRSILGLSFLLIFAVMLVMISFGYMQHLMSFSHIIAGEQTGGVQIQIARGVAAVLMFTIIMRMQKLTSIIYRVGLLVMIAGFMMMPFLFGSDLFWLSGAIVIVGYTSFDLLLWVLASQSAFQQSVDPIKTIALMRLIAVICTLMGLGVGILLIGNYSTLPLLASAETTVVGYMVVIAAVLVLSSHDLRALVGDFSAQTFKRDSRAVLDDYFVLMGLTSREKEIATFLIHGRTQPWIAQNLFISENTVSTHVRHIYRKAEVHNRQELVDNIAKAISHEIRDMPSILTD